MNYHEVTKESTIHIFEGILKFLCTVHTHIHTNILQLNTHTHNLYFYTHVHTNISARVNKYACCAVHMYIYLRFDSAYTS